MRVARNIKSIGQLLILNAVAQTATNNGYMDKATYQRRPVLVKVKGKLPPFESSLENTWRACGKGRFYVAI